MAFADRHDAGRRLAALLVESSPSLSASSTAPASPVLSARSVRSDYLENSARQPPVVMGMARGGVPVAFEVAGALDAPLDVVVVRKLGHPRQPELGLGAIAEDGVRLVNDALVRRLGVTEDVIDAVAARQTIELDRRLEVYRQGRAPTPVEGRTAIVVDDGLATGFTARAAIEVMRRRAAARVVLAVPVSPPDALDALRDVADDVACVETPLRLFGLSEWYDDFEQVSDAEVARLLALGASGTSGASGGQAHS
jgi:predicted phosphoribosyltransferase